MAAVAIDSLEYAHQLEAVGMPREQAEAVAKGITNMFIHNFEVLVTRDYLDTRFSEFETGINASVDRRFTQTEVLFVKQFSDVDIRFERMEGKFSLMYAMQGLTIACVVIPAIRTLLG